MGRGSGTMPEAFWDRAIDPQMYLKLLVENCTQSVSMTNVCRPRNIWRLAVPQLVEVQSTASVLCWLYCCTVSHEQSAIRLLAADTNQNMTC